MSSKLDRQLWRYEYGRLAPEMLELEIRQELDDIGSAALDLPAHSGTIRLWNADLLQARVDALHEAMRAVNRLHWRDAVQHLRRYETTLATIHELLQAVAAADRAEGMMNAVHDRAGVPRLRALPAVASLAQLVDTARQCILVRRYLRAANIATLTMRMAARFLDQREDGKDLVEQRLSDLDELAAATCRYAGADDDPATDGSLATLRMLFADGYCVLGERLLSELETQLGPRRRFLLHCRDITDSERARTLVHDLSWDGALDHYWHEALSQYAEIIEQQRLTVAGTIVSLDAALAGEERTPPKE